MHLFQSHAIRGLVLLSVLLLVACNPAKKTIFHADFDADTVGSPPAAHPPGPPADDEIEVDSNGPKVFNSYSLNSKSLELRAHSGWVHCWPDKTLGEYKSFRATWTGRANLAGGYLLVYLDLKGTLNPISPRPVALMFEDGQIKRVLDQSSVIGPYSEAENQVINIGVDLITAKYQVSVTQGFVSDWLPWDHEGGVLGTPTGMDIRITLAGGTSTSWYVMDTVYVYGFPP